MFVLQFRFWLFAMLLAFGALPLRAQLLLVDMGGITNSPASSNLVTLGWNPSPDPNAIGYFIGWGLASGDCTNQLDAGNVTSAMIGGLATNVTYYFTAAAYDSTGDESVPSNEFEYSLPQGPVVTNAPPAETNLPPSLGKFVLTTLVSFNGTNGLYPCARLIQGADGNFYSTTDMGGANGVGTTFRMAANGTLTTFVSFGGINGAYPLAGLVQGMDGSLFGTTSRGGAAAGGTTVQMAGDGTVTVLISFNFLNGAWPVAGLTQGTDHNFYGTTKTGGPTGGGIAFRIASGGTLTTLASFSGLNGAHPQAGLVQGSDGSFYGTTYSDGTGNSGAIFKMTTGGSLTALHSFTGAGDGASPCAELVQGSDGNFYGTTCFGGVEDCGTVFRITAAGAFTSLASFNGTNGANPAGALVQGSDGNFYGTTRSGGAYYTNQSSIGYGTVFRITPNGTLTTLVSFSGTNGTAPQAGLVQGTDGNFYGTTGFGGSFDGGTVFRLSFLAPLVIQTVTQKDGMLTLTWSATVGGTYQVQYSSDLNHTNWNNLGSSIVATSATATTTDSIGPDLQRFYRIVVAR